MLKIAAVLLLFPFTLLRVFAGQETAQQILARTGQTYKNLKTYQFSGMIAYSTSNAAGEPQAFQESFQCARGEDGRIRYQRGIGMSKILAVSDGSEGTIYIADKRQYQRSGSSDFETFLYLYPGENRCKSG